MKEEFKPALRMPHVLLITLLVSSILFNKYQNDETKKIADKQENVNLFLSYDEQIFGIRRLESDSESICKNAAKELRDYYASGDLKLIGLDEESKKKDKGKRPAYIDTLIDMVKNFAGGESGESEGNEDDENPGEGGNNGGEEGGEEGGEGDMSKNLLKYGMHLLPIIAFLVIAILSIPGWILCCGCCCCNCCCCCCCKKPCCRFPFFIIVMAFDFVVIIACIYGLAQSNNVFVGLGNFECSVLKFIEEVSKGETKEELPKWQGFGGISALLNNISETVKDYNPNAGLAAKQGAATTALGNLNDAITTSGSNAAGYTATIKKVDGTDDIVLKLLTIKSFGTGTETSGDTITAELKRQYKTISEESDNQATQAQEHLSTVDREKASITDFLGNASSMLDSFQEPINSTEDMVAGYIKDYGGMIEDYGKKAFKAIFSVLTIVDAAVAALLVIYFLFGTTLCLKCRCCRCLNKCFIHLFWNILALLMIFTFIIGALFTLIGTIGKDLVSVISYIIGPENVSKGESAILIGPVADYINRCTNGDGNLAEQLNMTSFDGVDSFEQLNDITKQLDETAQKINGMKNINTFQFYLDQLQENKEFKNVAFCNPDPASSLTDCDPNYSLDTSIRLFNEGQTTYELAITSCTKPPRTCVKMSEDLDTITGLDSDMTNRLNSIKSMKTYLTEPDNDSNHIELMKREINSISDSYNDLVEKEEDMIPYVKGEIRTITKLFDDYIGNGSMWSFINCKFIGHNIDIILKYLEEALGKNIYTVGIMLLLSACSIIFAINFTILEVIIINKAVDAKLEEEKKKVEDFPINSEAGRVVQYKMA